MIFLVLLPPRVAIAVLVAASMMWASTARSESERRLPQLTTTSSQFVELRPLVEAPPLELHRIDGKVVNLGSLEGKVVVLSFWATWCPPCRRELPMLERLQQLFDGRDVEVIPVSVDQAGKAVVVPFLERIGVRRLRSFLDQDGRVGARSAEDGSPFVLYSMPITYVIDRQGRPAGYITGEVDWTSQEALSLLGAF
jgi:thiol-disulfide isomerase/thioredoxin